MKFSEFRRYRPKPNDNVFGFICPDDFLVEESRQIWTGMFEGAWSIEKLPVKEFEDIEASRLFDDALTPSLFSQSRMLMISNSEKLTKRRIEDLATIQNVPQSSLKVILLFSSGKSGEGLARTIPTIQIDDLKSAEVAGWLMERYKVTPEIARYMVENVGTDLYPLHHEMEKLQTYVGDSRAIDLRDIDVLTLRSEQFGPFDLDDAILARNYPRAVRVVGAMIEEGAEPLLVLSRIVRVWRQLFIGKGLTGKFGAKEVAAAVNAPTWKAGELVTGCKRYQWKQLAQGFRELLHADRAFKTSSPRPEPYLDVLLWKIMQPEGH